MSNELGWNPAFDEGVRLLATNNSFSGIRVNLQTPSEYDCSTADSYFNFYLGFNQNPGKNSKGIRIETGISYSIKGWQAFINNDGKESNSSPINVGKGQLIKLELAFNEKGIRLMVGASALNSPASLSNGAPKMIVALHESHRDLQNRKVWFDKAQISCTEVRKIADGKWISPSIAKIAFDKDIIDPKLMDSMTTPYSLSATMNKPK
jgi:hypothetical protein